MTKKQKITLVAVFAAVLAVAAVIAVLLNNRSTVQGGKEFQVEVISERDDYNKITEASSHAEYLGEYLRTFEECEWKESEFGIFITGFSGIMEDQDNQYWWKVSVNGQVAATGVDEIPLQDGDKYTFTLTQGW